MERIHVEKTQLNLVQIVKRVEAGEQIIIAAHGKDVAHITPMNFEYNQKKKQFFTLLKQLKANNPLHIDHEEIKKWIEEGRA